MGKAQRLNEDRQDGINHSDECLRYSLIPLVKVFYLEVIISQYYYNSNNKKTIYFIGNDKISFGNPMVIGNYQLSITANFVNTGKTTVLPTLYCVIVSEGSFNISNGSCSHQIGILSPSDVLNAEILPQGSYSRSQEIYGGKFERLKAFFGKAHNFIKQNQLISKGLRLLPNPTAQSAASIAESLGYGSSGGGVEDYGGSLHATTKKLKKKMNLSDLA